MEKDVPFDVYLPKDDKCYPKKNNDLANICHFSKHLSAWLRIIEKDHWLPLDTVKSPLQAALELWPPLNCSRSKILELPNALVAALKYKPQYYIKCQNNAIFT